MIVIYNVMTRHLPPGFYLIITLQTNWRTGAHSRKSTWYYFLREKGIGYTTHVTICNILSLIHDSRLAVSLTSEVVFLSPTEMWGDFA